MEAGIYLLKSVAILSLFYMVYFVFLRKDTLFTAKRHFFLAGIGAALFLPFIEFTRAVYLEAPPFVPIQEIGLSPTPTEMAVVQDPEITINYWQIALIIYGVGVVIMALKLMVQIFSLLKLLRNYPSEKHENYTFVKVKDAVTPFSFFRYIVFNPESHSEEELKMILKHEQVHVSQWHSIDIIIGHLTRALQWVNPFSWWYKKSLEENLEFLADNETVSQVPSKKEYQLALVKTSSPLQAPALTTQFYQSFIKKRIIMLNKSTTKRRNLWKLSLVLPCLALFLWSFNVKEVINYKEATFTEEPRTPSFTITSETTNAELDAIEARLSNQARESSIRIDDRMRNEEDKLYKFSIKTKFRSQNDYHTNVVIGDDSEKAIGAWNFNYHNGAFHLNDLETQHLIKATEKGVEAEIRASLEANSITTGKKNAGLVARTMAIKSPGDKSTTKIAQEDAAEEFRFTITKNTTDVQLEQIKSELKKDHGIDMKYKVERNSSNEITSINISYSDNKGGSGNYSVNNDDEPIDDFVFYRNTDGERGFWSEEQEARRAERMAARMEEKAKRMEERAKRMEEREIEMIERKEWMEKKRLEREEEMEELREEMKEREIAIISENNVKAKRSYAMAKEMKEKMARLRDKEVIIIEGDGEKNWQKLKTPSGAYVYSSGSNDQGVLVITKDTSDKELSKMKKKMENEGIDFTYSKLKRNSSGEITRIKITVDGDENKKIISAKSDDGEPINEIIIYN